MRHLILALAALLVLAGCASTQSGISPELRVYALQHEYDALLEQAETYAELPACTDEIIVGCHEPEALLVLIDVAEEADTALDTAEAIVRDPATGESDAAVYVQAARAALARLASELAKAEMDG